MVIKHTGLEIEITKEHIYVGQVGNMAEATTSCFMINFDNLDRKTHSEIRGVVKDFHRSFRKILDICNL